MAYAFVTKYLPATDTKGARISVTHGRNQKLVVDFDFSAKEPHNAAILRCMKSLEKEGKDTENMTPPVGTYVRGPTPNEGGYIYVLLKEGDKLEII